MCGDRCHSFTSVLENVAVTRVLLCMCTHVLFQSYLSCFFCWDLNLDLSLSLSLFLSLLSLSLSFSHSLSLSFPVFISFCLSFSSFVSLTLHLLNPVHMHLIRKCRRLRPNNALTNILYSQQGTCTACV